MRLLVSIFMIFNSFALFGQQLKRVVTTYPKSDDVEEVYYVLASDKTIKHGDYYSFYKGELTKKELKSKDLNSETLGFRAKGKYQNNLKQGTWTVYKSPRQSSSIDGNGKVKAGYSDIATYEYKYDNGRNLTETRHLGENGKLIQVEFTGPAIIRYKYDKNKKKIEEAYFDTNNAPLKDMTKVVYTYDGSGKLIKKVAYDINGKIVD
jgi:hypothetical protein